MTTNPGAVYLNPVEKDPIKQNSAIRQLIERAAALGNLNFVTPEMFGAKGDGVSDDIPAISAAIASLVASGGGTVVFRANTIYSIGSTILVNSSNIRLIGAGSALLNISSPPDISNAAVTTILYNGVTNSDDPVIHIYPTGSTGLTACGLSDLHLDGNGKAGRGFHFGTIQNSSFKNISVTHVTAWAGYLDCQASSQITQGPTSAQNNTFENITWALNDIAAEKSAGGLQLTGTPTSFSDTGFGNWSYNHFANITGLTDNGDGFLLDNCDNNVFTLCRNFSKGTGRDFVNHGVPASFSTGSVDNKFIDCGWNIFKIEGTSDGWASGTVTNWIICGDLANASPFPTLGAGSSFIGPVGGFNSTPTWTPVVSSKVGTITSSTVNLAQWRWFGRVVFFSLQVQITNNGTGSDTLLITQPPSPFNSGSGILTDFGTTNIFAGANTTQGTMVWGNFFDGTHFGIKTYNNGYPVIANNDFISLSGWYIKD